MEACLPKLLVLTTKDPIWWIYDGSGFSANVLVVADNGSWYTVLGYFNKSGRLEVSGGAHRVIIEPPQIVSTHHNPCFPQWFVKKLQKFF